MRDTRFEPVEDRGLGIYCLRLRESKGGRFYVDRAEWWLWGGKVTPMDPHRVSGYYVTKDSTKAFCMGYVAEHAGCKTAEQARAVASGALA